MLVHHLYFIKFHHLRLVLVLWGEQLGTHLLRCLVRDEIDHVAEASDAWPMGYRLMVPELRVDGRDQLRDGRPHPSLCAEAHERRTVPQAALKEGDGQAVSEGQLMARRGRPQLLVVPARAARRKTVSGER